MAYIHPFRALRPTPDAAARVASVPYDVVNREEATDLVVGNPLSFLHVSRAEIDLSPSMSPYDPEVYRTAVSNLARLRREAPLVVEDEPSLYFYRLRMGSHEQTGVAGCYSIDEYDKDLIKKHERTRPEKEDDRTRHIVALHAQTGPVFLTYRAAAEIDAAADRAKAGAPLFDVKAPDGVQHTIWRVGDDELAALVALFKQVPALYIADGHHRAASAARARQELRSKAMATAAELASHKGVSEYDTFLAVAFPDNQMQILAYNRIVKDLGGLSPEDYLGEVRSRFTVQPGPASPSRKGEIGMYLGGTWYTLDVGPVDVSGPDGLDVSVLQSRLLDPVLKIVDVRTDKRIDFVGGARGTAELEKLVDAGRAAVAFSMFPVTIEDLLSVADANGIMPPKSTWFEPKLRDGFLSHVI